MPEACNATQYSPEINMYAHHTREIQNKLGKHASSSAESAQISWELLLHLAASTMTVPTTVAHTVRSGIRTMYVRVLMDKNQSSVAV